MAVLWLSRLAIHLWFLVRDSPGRHQTSITSLMNSTRKLLLIKLLLIYSFEKVQVGWQTNFASHPTCTFAHHNKYRSGKLSNNNGCRGLALQQLSSNSHEAVFVNRGPSAIHQANIPERDQQITQVNSKSRTWYLLLIIIQIHTYKSYYLYGTNPCQKWRSSHPNIVPIHSLRGIWLLQVASCHVVVLGVTSWFTLIGYVPVSPGKVWVFVSHFST